MVSDLRMSRFPVRLPAWNADLAAFTTAAVFSLLVWSMFNTESHAGAFQRQVRIAQEVRAATLRVQLDEELGLRGYVATGRREFLQSYHGRRRLIAYRLEGLKRALQTLGDRVSTTAAQAVDDERSTNSEWEHAVAVPLIADRDRTDAAALQLKGKRLIDRSFAKATRASSSPAAANGTRGGTEAHEAGLKRSAPPGILGAIGLVVLVRLLTRTSESLRKVAKKLSDCSTRTKKRIADSLQQAFLQRSLPAVPSLGMHAVYMPAEQQARVGGDWYDVVQGANGRLFCQSWRCDWSRDRCSGHDEPC